MTKEVIFHSLVQKKEWFSGRFVKVVYFPSGIYLFLQKYQNDFIREFKLSNFRSYLNSTYPFVLTSIFDHAALSGKEPWIYLDDEFNDVDISFLYEEFLNHLEVQLNEKYPGDKIPLEVRECILVSRSMELTDVFQFKSADKFFEAFYSYVYSNQNIDSRHLYEVKIKEKDEEGKIVEKREKRELILPSRWYHSFNGEKHESVSFPFVPHKLEKKKEFHYASFVMSVEIQSVSEEGVVFFVKHSLRRWISNPLIRKGYVDYPEGKMRSLYMWFEEFNTNSLVRFSTKKKSGGISFQYDHQTVSRLNKMGFNIDVMDIALNPKNYYPGRKGFIALFPYQLEDKDEKRNLLQSGVSVFEKKYLFELFIKKNPETKLYESPVLVKTPKTSLENYMSFPELSSTKKKMIKGRTITIEIYTREDDKAMSSLIAYAMEKLSFKNEQKLEEKMSGYIFVRQESKENSFLAVQMKNKHTKEIDFYLRFEFKQWEKRFFGPLENKSKKSSKNATKKRILEIEKNMDKKGDITLSLIEIDEYKGTTEKLTDPKFSIMRGMGKANRIVQNFHPLLGKKDTAKKEIIISAIRDLLSREGFVNQRLGTYLETLNQFVIYSPVTLKNNFAENNAYVYAISRFKDGEVKIKYEDSDWIDIGESIIRLLVGAKEKKSPDGIIGFYEQVIKEDGFENNIVVMNYMMYSRLNYLSPFDEKIPIAVFDIDASRNPYISNEDNGLPGKGTFLCKAGNAYYSIAPKMKSESVMILQANKKERNEAFRSRLTSKMFVVNMDSVDSDEVVKSVHLLRNITLTFDSFVNNPYPIHIFKHHKKMLMG